MTPKFSVRIGFFEISRPTIITLISNERERLKDGEVWTAIKELEKEQKTEMKVKQEGNGVKQEYRKVKEEAVTIGLQNGAPPNKVRKLNSSDVITID